MGRNTGAHMTWLENNRGVSLIAAIFIIVVLAFMGLMFVSLINISSLTAVNDLQSTQAFSIAEGGIEYGKEVLASYSFWYNFANDPFFLATNQALGNGSFTTTINVPATTVRKSSGAGANEIRVFSIDQFPSPGGTIYVGGTVMAYTSIATDLPKGPRFIFPAAIGTTVFAGTYLYPIVTLSAGITATDTTIPFAGNSSKFLQKGTITIDDPVNGDEEITCTGIQTT